MSQLPTVPVLVPPCRPRGPPTYLHAQHNRCTPYMMYTWHRNTYMYRHLPRGDPCAPQHHSSLLGQVNAPRLPAPGFSLAQVSSRALPAPCTTRHWPHRGSLSQLPVSPSLEEALEPAHVPPESQGPQALLG